MLKNKNDIKIMLKEAAVLLVITVFAGLVLGFVHELTVENIARQEALAIEEACRSVFPSASGFEETAYVPGDELAAMLSESGTQIGKVYDAQNAEGKLLGYVIESASLQGYGGKVDLYLGVTSDGKLNGVSILEINETVGLGMEAEKILVPQFTDKKAELFTYTKTGSTSETEIDAISGATVTTKAFVNAVNAGIAAAAELAGGGGFNE